MARARNIKPSFFTNELLGTEDPMISLTFAGLWCLADKVGVLEDRPLRIKAELFPYRDSLDVNGYLTRLARLGFIVRYKNGGRSFIQVCNFRKHQSPHHTERGKGFPFHRDPKSLIVEGNGYETVNEPGEDREEEVPERSDSLIPDSLIPDSGFTDSLIPDSLIQKTFAPQGAEPKQKRKSRIPDQFMVTKEMREWAGCSAPAVNIKTETENFCDYWRGAGGTKADWVATWRTWMRKAQKDSQQGGRVGYKPFNKQAAVEENNQRVVQEIIDRERRLSGGSGLEPIDLGDSIIIEGEVIHAE